MRIDMLIDEGYEYWTPEPESPYYEEDEEAKITPKKKKIRVKRVK